MKAKKVGKEQKQLLLEKATREDKQIKGRRKGLKG